MPIIHPPFQILVDFTGIYISIVSHPNKTPEVQFYKHLRKLRIKKNKKYAGYQMVI